MDQNLESIAGDIKKIMERLNHIEAKLQLRQTEANLPPPREAHLPFEARKNSLPRADVSPRTRDIGPALLPTAPSYRSLTENSNRLAGSHSSLDAGTLFGIIGAICFVLGSAFLIKLSIDDGWLTPLRQYALSQILSVIFVIVGIWLHGKDHQYSGLIAGTGVVVAFMSAFAGNHYFNVLSREFSLAVSILVAMLSLWLREKFESDSFSVLAAAGTFLSPLILKFSDQDLWVKSAYFLIWSAAFSMIATRIKSRVTLLVSAYFGMGTYLLSSAPMQLESRSIPHISLVLFIQFSLFIGAVVTYSIVHKKPLERNEAAAYFPILLFFYAIENFLLNRWVPDWAPWIGLLFGSSLLFAYFYAKSKLESGSLESGWA